MTDAEVGTRIVQAVRRLKRAKAELAALGAEVAEKRQALQAAGDMSMKLTCEGGRGLIRHDKGEAAEPWPTFEEMRSVLQRQADKRNEVASLQKAVKEMSGLDRDLLS